jgi:hypothetical protein
MGLPAINGSHIRVSILVHIIFRHGSFLKCRLTMCLLCVMKLNSHGYCLQSMEVTNNITIHICYPFPEEFGENYPKIIVMFRFLCYYAIPLFIIGVFYVLIAKHLFYSAHNMPGEIQGAQRQVSN